MKKIYVFISALFIFLNYGNAQNTSPYWSLVGNSNATATSKLGTTNDVSLRFYTNNVQRMIINSAAGNVGIGITSPVNIFTVKSGGGTPAASWLNGLSSPVFVGFGEVVSSEFLLAGASNTANNRAVFQGRRSRGTLAAPAAVVNNDYITSLLASAYDGSTFQNPALVSFFVDGTPSAGNVPTRISFVTGSNAGNRTERLKVGSTGNFDFNNGQVYLQKSSGNLGVGTSSPGAKLHVAGASLFADNLNVTAGGITATNTSVGVSGESTGGSYGVFGSSNYLGVYGYAPSGTYGVFGYGGTYGVNGSSSNSAYGVYGTSSTSYSANGSTGVYGSAYYGVHGKGTLGVWGEGTSYGLYGTSSDYAGVYANGASYGVIGSGATGLYGSSSASSGFGVYGYTSGSSAYAGYFLSANYRGIYVESDPSWFAGYFVGDVYSTGSFIGSDMRVKKDVKNFSNAMDIINKLQPKNYEFKSDGNYSSMHLPKGRHYGFIAQDLEKILPNLVKEEKHEVTNKEARARNLELVAEGKVPATETVNGKNETKEEMDLKAVNYTELIPIIVRGMQEQQTRIEELTEINAELKNQVNELKSLILQGDNGSSITSLSGYLKQNIPNPAANATVISYYLPENITHAQIEVTDMKGSVLKVYSASGGTGQVNIRNGELPAGVYNYTLYANNKKLDTKQMVIMK